MFELREVLKGVFSGRDGYTVSIFKLDRTTNTYVFVWSGFVPGKSLKGLHDRAVKIYRALKE